MFKKNKINFNLLVENSYVGLIVSSLALVLLASAIFWAPYLNSDDVVATDDAGVPSAQASYTNPTVSLGLADRIDLDIMPTAAGATSSASATLTVATTESAGYSIYLSAADNNLRSVNPANTSVIAPAETGGVGTTLENMTANTWGYALTKEAISDTTTYQGVSTDVTTPVVIQETASGSANDAYNLSFGTKVDSSLASGAYLGSILISVVATPEVITLSKITYMQEITNDICTASTENETKQLIDIRDSNSYWVAKLKDGNCWMTQNLALDLTTAGLSASDTDIDTDWNASSTYAPNDTFMISDTNRITSGSTTQTNTYSWNLGKWVLSTPGQSTSCGTSAKAMSDCITYGFIDVSGSEWKPTYTATGTGAGIKATDEDTKTYDPHYLIGNYYQWNTATAGTGGTIIGANATGSICPKGWRLPVSIPGNSAIDRSYYNLLSKYGLASAVTGTGADDGLSYNIAANPLYFVRSGYVDIRYGTLGYAANNGYGWSSVAYSSGTSLAYYLVFNASSVNPSGFDLRYSGRSVRCLADGN